MARGLVNPDPQNTPRQRRFDQRVAKVLNDLIRNGSIVEGDDGWEIGSGSGESVVLQLRTFNFTPRYGQWG